MVFIGSITSFYKASFMNGNKAVIVKNTDHRPCVDYFELPANMLIRSTVIVFILPKVNMVVPGKFIFFVVLYFKDRFR